MAGCDFQAVPGGRAERRASAARPSTRLLEEQLCTHPVNHRGATHTESSRQRLKEKEGRPSRRLERVKAQSDFSPSATADIPH
jgi:hypothetical protein